MTPQDTVSHRKLVNKQVRRGEPSEITSKCIGVIALHEAILSYLKLRFLLYCRQDNLIPSIGCWNPAADIFHWPSDPSSWESLEKPKAALEVAHMWRHYGNMGAVSSHKLAFQCSSQLHWHSFASRSPQHLSVCLVFDSHFLPTDFCYSHLPVCLDVPSLKSVKLRLHVCNELFWLNNLASGWITWASKKHRPHVTEGVLSFPCDP